MLKAQDLIVLIKLLANPGDDFSQRSLSSSLCISLSEINASLKRLVEANLLRKSKSASFLPILAAAEEFLLYAVKYFFPGKLGELIQGVPTAVGASLFDKKIARGNDPIPVWPDIHGSKRGLALLPIHPAITKSLRQSPDQEFYELLVLIDVIRSGQAREKNIAIKLLKKKFEKLNG